MIDTAASFFATATSATAFSATMIPLAFQVFDAVGWVGQVCFTLRTLTQWLASERAKKSVVPMSFWWLSLAGAAAIVVYQLHRRDPVFLAGALINLAIYVRNMWLVRAPRSVPRSPWLPLLLGLLAFGGLACVAVYTDTLKFASIHWFWLAFGIAVQVVWSSRFVVQWVLSERQGRSHLPAAFFWLSLVGCIGLFIYAVARLDWVMMAAYVLNPIPYIRNLLLIRRAKTAPDQAGGTA